MARHAIGWLSVLALWLGLAGCGGGGGSSASSDGEPVGTPQAPAFEVLYPGSNAATGASSLPVVGRITSGGAEVTGVSLLAGGGEVQAALDASGHWRGVVEVAAGNNRIQVLAQRSGAAAVEVASVKVERTLLLNRPGTAVAEGDGLFVEDAGQIYRLTASGAALDPVATPPVGASAFAVNGNTLWVRVGDAIEAIDLQTGDVRRQLSVPPPTPLIRTIADVGAGGTLLYDAASDRLLLIGSNAVFAGPASGPEAEMVRVQGLPGGLFNTIGAAYLPDDNAVIVLAPGPTPLQYVNLTDGSTRSAALPGSQTSFPPTGIARDPVTGELFVVAGTGLFSVDPLDLSATSVPWPDGGPAPEPAARLSIGDDAFWVSGSSAVWRIGREGGRTRFGAAQIGSGTPLNGELNGHYDRTTNELLTGLFLSWTRLEVASGRRTSNSIPAGALFEPFRPAGFAASADARTAWSADGSTQRVFELDFDQRTRREVSGPAVGSGPLPEQLGALALSADGSRLYLADEGSQFAFNSAVLPARVLELNLASGERSVIAELPGGGRLLRGMALDAARNRLIVEYRRLSVFGARDGGLDADLLTVDLGTQAVAPLADLRPSLPAPVELLSAVQFVIDGDLLYYPVNAVDPVTGLWQAMAHINLLTGAVSLPDAAAASGPRLPFLSALVGDSTRLFALNGTPRIVAVDPLTGSRAVISQ